MIEASAESVAMLLPDLPRWVEVRSALLSGHGSALGLHPDGSPDFVMQAKTGEITVVGSPPIDIIRRAAAQTREVWSVPENADWTAAALPGWSQESAIIHVLGDRSQIHTARRGTVRQLDSSELPTIPEVPSDLLEELLAEDRLGTSILAAFAAERPVAFCYAGSITERWWDVSIDTLEPYRRKGYAAQCFAACFERMDGLGKQPVWGAMVSNVASARLATKLGFEPVDTLVLFSPPG